MKLAQGQSTRKAEINLVPLLDSIFILIFFFMFAMTTMVKRQGLSVALPASQSGKKVVEKVTLTVKEDGALFWNKEPFPESLLKDRLLSFKQAQPNSSLVIRGDRNTPFERIVKILDQAESVQLKKVTIETESQ